MCSSWTSSMTSSRSTPSTPRAASIACSSIVGVVDDDVDVAHDVVGADPDGADVAQVRARRADRGGEAAEDAGRLALRQRSVRSRYCGHGRGAEGGAKASPRALAGAVSSAPLSSEEAWYEPRLRDARSRRCIFSTIAAAASPWSCLAARCVLPRRARRRSSSGSPRTALYVALLGLFLSLLRRSIVERQRGRHVAFGFLLVFGMVRTRGSLPARSRSRQPGQRDDSVLDGAVALTRRLTRPTTRSGQRA